MKLLRAPGLGPIVGHTSDKTARLWIRADDPADDGVHLDSDRRSLGVAGIVKRNGADFDGAPVYFRLHREFDRTGSFEFGVDASLATASPSASLDPTTEYEIAMATFSVDDPNDEDDSISDAQLASILPPPDVLKAELRTLGPEARARFTTFPKVAPEAEDRLCFLLGSCRYPGLMWAVKRSDRVFAPMLAQARASGAGVAPARFTMMIGDQIYADLFNRVLIGRADTYKEFQSRYIEAFGSRNMRVLLRSTPTYMILDDHEIEDNWTQDRLRKAAKHSLFNTAIAAYQSYQWSHGPRTWGRKLFYTFDCGGYPFFVLDTRTQRTKDSAPGLEDNHLLGRPGLDPNEPSQIDCLLKWLAKEQRDHGDRPKFVVSPSVFVPNQMNERQGAPGGTSLDPADPKVVTRLEQSDAWPAYPKTRRALLGHIVANRIQNVVFLCGDVHCSNVSRMSFTRRDGQDLGLVAHCITSSAFYWPFPFADGNPSDFVHDSRAPGQEDTFRVSEDVDMNYQAWNFTQEDNFCRLTLDKTTRTLRVEVFDSQGKSVVVAMTGQSLQADLPLAGWT